MPPKRKVGEVSTRFSDSEKTFLEEIVLDFPAIRSKETNKFGLEQKQEAWERVTELFNAEPNHTKRTCTQLKKCWDNIKQRKKEKLTELKAQRLRTGGGPSVPVPDYSPVENEFGGDIDIEIQGTIDSDTIQEVVIGSNSSYAINADGVLIPTHGEELDENPDDPPFSPAPAIEPIQDETERRRSQLQSTTPQTSTIRLSSESRASNRSSIPSYLTGRKSGIAAEQQLRKEKFEKQEKRDEELHELRKEELEIRREIADIERETLKKEAIERVKKRKFETDCAELLYKKAEIEFANLDQGKN